MALAEPCDEDLRMHWVNGKRNRGVFEDPSAQDRSMNRTHDYARRLVVHLLLHRSLFRYPLNWKCSIGPELSAAQPLLSAELAVGRRQGAKPLRSILMATFTSQACTVPPPSHLHRLISNGD